jgi:hypothetical protein
MAGDAGAGVGWGGGQGALWCCAHTPALALESENGAGLVRARRMRRNEKGGASRSHSPTEAPASPRTFPGGSSGPPWCRLCVTLMKGEGQGLDCGGRGERASSVKRDAPTPGRRMQGEARTHSPEASHRPAAPAPCTRRRVGACVVGRALWRRESRRARQPHAITHLNRKRVCCTRRERIWERGSLAHTSRAGGDGPFASPPRAPAPTHTRHVSRPTRPPRRRPRI